MTRCEIAEIPKAGSAQMAGFAKENKKAQRPDRFCLTEPGPRSYFAGSPPSACGGKEAAGATPCGTIVESGCSTWGWKVGFSWMVSCVWLEVCCGI